MPARLLSLLLALLVFQAVPAPESAPAPSILSEEEAAAFLCAAGLLEFPGEGFSTEQPMTRAALAVFLYRHAGSPALPSPRVFLDVPPDCWFALPAAWAWEAGLMDGSEVFGPDEPVSLEALRCILARYAGIPQEEQAAWELPDMDGLQPEDPLTQGQAAVLLAWFCLSCIPAP